MHSRLAYGLKWIAAPAAALLLAACGDASVGDLFDEPEPPASSTDAGPGTDPVDPDAGPSIVETDADAADAEVQEGDGSDAEVPDGDGSDAEVPDGAVPDAEVPDGGNDAQTGMPPIAACDLAITSLNNGQVLTAADDADDSCANGLQYALSVSTSAADGTELSLQVNGQDVATATVTGGTAQFAGVDIPLGDIADVEVSLDATCSAMVAVQATCPVTPSCVIASPANGAVLNGVGAPFGDRTGAGLGFATSVVVETDLANGERVLLTTVGGVTLAGEVVDGSVEFPAVSLEPDGSFELFATCVGDVEAESERIVVTVDTTPPQIITGAVTPTAGRHFSPSEDQVPATPVLDFDVCIPVASPDALNVGDNVCVTIVGGAQVCAPATLDGNNGSEGACLTLECPGSAAFSLEAIVTDGVGNPSAAHSIAGITCASEEPSVQITSIEDTAVGDPDISRRLLNAATPGATLIDERPDLAGAQHTLVACSNAEGGQARALAGAEGETLAEIAAFIPLVEDAAGLCPVDLDFIAVFSEVTLPESAVDAAGELTVRTEVRVEVVAVSTESNQTSPARLWVDTTLPELTLADPTRAALCDSITPMTSLDITLASTAYPSAAVLTVTNSGSVDATYEFTDTTAQAVNLPEGVNVITAATTEPSGNQAALAACSVRVGSLPTVVWTAPPATTTILNGANTTGVVNAVADADGATAGWQGTLTVDVSDLQPGDVAAGQVQFLVDGVELGTAIPLMDAVGDDTTRTVTLDLAAEGLGVADALSATLTASVTGTVNGDGSGDFGPLLVDTVAPGLAANVAAAVGPNPGDRRHTRFQVTWEGAGDGTDGSQTVGGYDVAYSTTAITDDATFQTAFDAAPVVTTTAPAAPTGADSVLIEGLNIETTYFFALRAQDAAGNVGPVAAAASSAVARLLTQEILPPAGFGIDDAGCTNSAEDCLLQFGSRFDGSTDLNGDSLSDLVVATNTGDAVFIYLADATSGTYPAAPTTVIRGAPGSLSFGGSVAVIGDFDGDMPTGATPAQEAAAQDIAIVQNFIGADPTEGAVHIVSGRDWSAVSDIDLGSINFEPADAAEQAASEAALAALGVYTIRANGFPSTVARVGNFDGDAAGSEDLLFGRSVESDFTLDGAVVAVHGGAPIARLVELEDPSLDGRRREYLAPVGGNTELGVELVGVGPLFSNGFIAGNSGFNRIVAGPGYQWAVAGEGATGVQILNVADTSAVPQVNSPASDSLGLSGVQLLGGQGYAIARSSHEIAGTNPPRRGEVDVYFGTGVDRLNAAPDVTLQDAATINNFGQVALGTGYSGRPASYSTPLIGDAGNPDLVVASASYFNPPDFVEEPPFLRIIRGDALAGLSGTVDLVNGDAAASVRTSQLQTPISFGGNFDAWSEAFGGTIRDMNGDGFAEIVLVERRPATGRGRLIILY